MAADSRVSNSEPPRRDLIDEIRRLALKHRATPRRIDLRVQGRHQLGFYVSEFGSWEAALEEALNEPRQSGRL